MHRDENVNLIKSLVDEEKTKMFQFCSLWIQICIILDREQRSPYLMLTKYADDMPVCDCIHFKQ